MNAKQAKVIAEKARAAQDLKRSLDRKIDTAACCGEGCVTIHDVPYTEDVDTVLNRYEELGYRTAVFPGPTFEIPQLVDIRISWSHA